MNNEIAGNIMSLVNGFGDSLAAVAKELNATSTVWHSTGSDSNLGGLGGHLHGMPAQSVVFIAYVQGTQGSIKGRSGGQTPTEQIPIFLSILSSSSLRTNNTRRRNACSQAYNLILNGQERSMLRDVDPTEYTVPPDICE